MLEYNTQRPHLRISEYGRIVQKMIDHALTLENKTQRTTMAKLITSVMAQVCPQSKESADYKHKLWDQLFIMSDYRLDVDSPYPMPTPRKTQIKPQPLPYPEGNIEYPHYGKYIQKMIQKITTMPEGKEKEILIGRTAHYLKKAYLTWNRDSVNDTLIHENFAAMSDGELKLTESFRLKQTKDLLNLMHNHKSKNNKNHSYKSNKNKPGNNRNKKKTNR